jgi:hypothetical protein
VRIRKAAALAALFAAGVLLASAVATGGRAADTTTTETTTELTTTTETSSSPTTTVLTTTTLEQTTTRKIIAPSPTTTSSESNSNDVPGWAWAAIGILAVGFIVLAVVLLTHRGGRSTVSPDERRRRLDDAVRGWVMQGWAIDGQTTDSTVLSRGRELMLVSVDDSGRIGTRSLQPGSQP